MESLKDYELVVMPGNLPIWRILLSALCITAAVVAGYYMCERLYLYDITDPLIKSCGGFMQVIGLGMGFGIPLATSKAVLIDIDKDILISRYYLGPFTFNTVSVVPELEYVSIYRDQKENYHANLWYTGNRFYNMYSFREKEPAIEFGKIAARKLKIDLLDATDREAGSHWIDI